MRVMPAAKMAAVSAIRRNPMSFSRSDPRDDDHDAGVAALTSQAAVDNRLIR